MKLNENKTEIMLAGNPRTLKDLPRAEIMINNEIIQSSDKVKNLGVLLESDFSMTAQINNLRKSMYFQLQKISSVRPFLTQSAAQTLITTLVLSKLDYCNAILSGVTMENVSKLQTVQNHAAKLILRRKKSDHVTPILKELHWLPVDARISYKTALLCYKCLNDAAPEYLKDFLDIYTPSRPLRSSSDHLILKKTLTNYKSYGERSFLFSGPNVWNSLPFSIRNAPNVNIFKKRLKHHLFALSYSN